MKSIRLRVFVVVALIAALPYVAPAPTMEQAPPANGKKSMQLQDIIEWKTVGATSLSKNGEWFAYRVAPQEGDAELIVKNVASGKELKFPLGEAAGGAGIVIGGEVIEHLAHFATGMRVQRIHHLGPRNRDVRDVVLLLVAAEFHASPPAGVVPRILQGERET